MEKFWMMVLAVIVAVLLMNLVITPMLSVIGVKESARKESLTVQTGGW